MVRAGHVDAAALLQISSFTAGLKQRMDVLMRPTPGGRLLDVGCGPGDDTRRLAAAVSPCGLVVGLDKDPDMVGVAAATTPGFPHPRCITYVVGDAAQLPYADGLFEACRCERVLQHVVDPARVVSEMVRVTAPGGVIVTADSDWMSLSIHGEDEALERRIVGFVAQRFRSGSAGRRLRDLLTRAGLTDIVVEAHCVAWTRCQEFRNTSFMAAGIHRALIEDGSITREEWDRFVHGLEGIDARGGFLATATLILASGIKPMHRERHASRS